MSRRQEILDAVKVELNKISGANVTQVPRSIEDLQDAGKLPALVVRYLDEEKENALTSGSDNKSSKLKIGVQVYVRAQADSDPLNALNTLFASIEKEVDDDFTLGKSYPVFARVTAVGADSIMREADEAGGSRYGVGAVEISIDYRNDRGTP